MGADIRPIQVIDYGEPNGTGLKDHPESMNASWKFLIVEDDNSLFFLVGPLAEYPYHANLLDAFCADREIIAHWENKPDLLRLDTDKYNVCGGGWIQFDAGKNRLVFFGRSTAYGEYESELVKEVVDSSDIFSCHEVIIR